MDELVQIKRPQQNGEGQPRRRVYIRTYGCQMNEYDTEKLYRILDGSFDKTSEPEQADLIILNTCSVREKPEHKVHSLLGELRELKSQNPHLLVGVGGCVAQQEGRKIVERSPVVDFVFGTHNLSLVPSLIERRASKGQPQVAVDYRDEWEDLPLGFSGGERVSALVSISRGCNKNCTYCIVPTTRGREVSRDPDEIKKEVRIAVHQGAKEIVLLGQTVNSYGLDFQPRRSFVWLLKEVAAIPGVERIRFTSPHPQEVRADFIDLVCSEPKICHHIHMPLQSGSDSVLKAMNRNYRRDKYLRIIDALKTRVPDMAITTDIIVGFPGETEQDFRLTLDVMEQVQFDNSYSFIFSARPGTLAATIEDSQPYQEKLARLQELQAKQEQITSRRLHDWVGKSVDVLIDGPSAVDPTRLQGRSSQNITVNLSGEAADLKPGMTVPTLIHKAARFTLVGEPAGSNLVKQQIDGSQIACP
ncbi:MAG: tRNA (N6-isopentenyl adenosine(37)-C2)-methylthiotransferase MiaB [Oligoflexia bacterium]|nr:tRNA (N6-isopentenyl adenosine(37)-C2)-methylthiotransferase MiaB [Oligoflexia bacterium]